MAVNTKRVFYVKYLAAPDFAETLGARRPDVRLDKLENDSADAGSRRRSSARRMLTRSARHRRDRDQIPRYRRPARPHAETADRVQQRRGLRHRRRRGVHGSGRAVVNQAGGNAQAVAEHVLGMMLALAKRIVESTRQCGGKEKFERTGTKATR